MIIMVLVKSLHSMLHLILYLRFPYTMMILLLLERGNGSFHSFHNFFIRDGASGKLKLATYLFMDNDSSPKKMRYYEKEEVKFSPAPNFYFQLPPTCVDTPQCGPKIGMDCSNSDNCFLDAHQFMCCAGMYYCL